MATSTVIFSDLIPYWSRGFDNPDLPSLSRVSGNTTCCKQSWCGGLPSGNTSRGCFKGCDSAVKHNLFASDTLLSSAGAFVLQSRWVEFALVC